MLIIASRDLTRFVSAAAIAPTLQAALDHWAERSPRLQRLADELEHDKVASSPLHAERLAAPLPRAYSWMDGSAYLNHMELARRLRNAKPPEGYLDTPIMYEGISSAFLACRDPLPRPTAIDGNDIGLDIECELGAIVDDVLQGASANDAAGRIRLLTIINDTSLRTVMADHMARGYQASVHGKPPCSMPMVAVTPDELGSAWDGRKLSLPMLSHINIGTGIDVTIAELAQTIALITGFKGRITFDTSKPDGTPRKLMDVSLLSRLGWQASINLHDGLKDAYQWYLTNSV